MYGYISSSILSGLFGGYIFHNISELIKVKFFKKNKHKLNVNNIGNFLNTGFFLGFGYGFLRFFRKKSLFN